MVEGGMIWPSVPEAQIVETLVEEALRLADEMTPDGEAGEPVVSVG